MSFSMCKFGVSSLLFIRLCLIVFVNVINVMINCVNLWPISMWKVKGSGKGGQICKKTDELGKKKVRSLDRLPCGECCAFVEYVRLCK